MEENLQYLLNSRNQCSVTSAPTSSDVDIHIQIQVTFKKYHSITFLHFLIHIQKQQIFMTRKYNFHDNISKEA